MCLNSKTTLKLPTTTHGESCIKMNALSAQKLTALKLREQEKQGKNISIKKNQCTITEQPLLKKTI